MQVAAAGRGVLGRGNDRFAPWIKESSFLLPGPVCGGRAADSTAAAGTWAVGRV